MDVELIKTRIINRRDGRSQKPLTNDHVVWQAFAGEHYNCLNALLREPLTFNPRNYPNVLQPSNHRIGPEDDEGPDDTHLTNTPRYYLRCARKNNLHDLQQFVSLYQNQFPADNDWSQQLLDSANTLQEDQQCTLIYVGMTLASSPDQRLQQDLTISGGTRFTNLTKIDARATEWIVYEIVGLQLQNNMSVVTAGYIEDIWIKAIGDVAVNSANGGAYVDWYPNQDLIASWRNAATRFNYPNQYNGTPAPAELQQHIQDHFNDYARFLKRQENASLKMPIPRDALVQNVRDTATPRNIINGQVVSVLIGKDITIKAFNSSVGFWQDTGSCPFFLREIYELLFTLASGNVPTAQNYNYPTFVDVYPLSYKQVSLVGVPYMCRYLRQLRPLIITSMSHLLFSMFHLDLLETAWKGPAERFLNMVDKPQSFTFFENIISTAFSSTGFFTRYNEDLGNVSIVSYGPDPLDLALLVPMRHPGSLKYDPILQQLKAQEIFLVACCSLVLEGIVRQRLNTGETKPQNRADLLNWLQDIRQEYNQYLDNNPLGRHLRETKQTLSDVENRIQSERVNAAKRRREDQGVTIRVQSQRRSQRLTNTFPGAPHSQDRINKLNQLRTLEDSRLARGLVYSIAPCPPGIVLFSDAYREWFLHAKSGKDMQYSANAFGNDPTRDLDEEGRDDYLKKRKLGRYGALANVERNQMARQKVALVDLTTESQWNKTGDRGLTIATCIFCGRSLYKTKNTTHRCPELEQEVLTSENNGLSYAYAFYAHDMLDAIEFDLEDREQVPAMDEHDAATILNQRNYKNRNNRVEGSLGLVYAALDSSDEFLFTQAVDREIQASGPGQTTPPDDEGKFFIQQTQIQKQIIKHLAETREMPLIEIRCNEPQPCDSYTIKSPSRRATSQRPVPRNAQHKHGRVNSSMCRYGQIMNNFDELPISLRRWLWYMYRKALSKNPQALPYQDPTNWQATHSA